MATLKLTVSFPVLQSDNSVRKYTYLKKKKNLSVLFNIVEINVSNIYYWQNKFDPREAEPNSHGKKKEGVNKVSRIPFHTCVHPAGI